MVTFFIFFFFNDTPPTEIYTLSLHDALPISRKLKYPIFAGHDRGLAAVEEFNQLELRRDRKSTRLNSSHRTISYAVFCLKKKKQHKTTSPITNTTDKTSSNTSYIEQSTVLTA